MTSHGIKAIYQEGHSNDPEIILSEDGVDALIDTLLAADKEHEVALLYSLQRPSLPSGYPDHEFCIGVDSELMVGVATFMDAASGNLTSLGPFVGRGDFIYLLAGHAREFLDRSEIPLALLRKAVKEFMTSGGQLPTCIEWRSEYP